jgi:hypothetical protein
MNQFNWQFPFFYLQIKKLQLQHRCKSHIVEDIFVKNFGFLNYCLGSCHYDDQYLVVFVTNVICDGLGR